MRRDAHFLCQMIFGGLENAVKAFSSWPAVLINLPESTGVFSCRAESALDSLVTPELALARAVVAFSSPTLARLKANSRTFGYRFARRRRRPSTGLRPGRGPRSWALCLALLQIMRLSAGGRRVLDHLLKLSNLIWPGLHRDAAFKRNHVGTVRVYRRAGVGAGRAAAMACMLSHPG